MKKIFYIVVVCASVVLPANADLMINLNPAVGTTNVATGLLTLDELWTANTFTYTNVSGGNLDIKVSASKFMVNSTGLLNYTVPNSSLSFEFFAAGTTNPVLVSGFAINWLDLDSTENAGPFSIVGAGGVTYGLNTSDPSIFQLGSALSPVKLLGSPTFNGIGSSVSGDWNNGTIQFDVSTVPISKFTLANTTGWIAPTNSTMNLTVVPVPAAFLLGLLGMGAAGMKLRKHA